MANITLPSNPVNGQKVVIGTRLFQYDSTSGRWKSRVFQPLGDTSITVPNESPTITASLSEIALDTSGANVSFTYTVSDVDSSILKVSHSVSGIANSDLATVTHHRANNTVTITAGTEEFANSQITLTVTDGRNNASDTVNVSASYTVNYDFLNGTQAEVLTTGGGVSSGDPPRFGDSISVQGNNAIIGSTRQDTGVVDGGIFETFKTQNDWDSVSSKVTSTSIDNGSYKYFGQHVKIDNNTVVATQSDRAYVYKRNTVNDNFSYSQRLTGCDSYADLQDNIIVAQKDDNTGFFVWTRPDESTSFTNVQTLAPSGVTQFGVSLIHPTTKMIAVGGRDYDTPVSLAGGIFLYTTDDETSWTLDTILQREVPEDSDLVGSLFCILGDRIAGVSDNGAKVTIWINNGGTWSVEDEFDRPASLPYISSMAGTDNFLFIGTADIEGGVSIYTRSGSTWALQTTINAENVPYPTYTSFGDCLDFQENSSLNRLELFVGAPRYRGTIATNEGRVFLWTFPAT